VQQAVLARHPCAMFVCLWPTLCICSMDLLLLFGKHIKWVGTVTEEQSGAYNELFINLNASLATCSVMKAGSLKSLGC